MILSHYQITTWRHNLEDNDVDIEAVPFIARSYNLRF